MAGTKLAEAYEATHTEHEFEYKMHVSAMKKTRFRSLIFPSPA